MKTSRTWFSIVLGARKSERNFQVVIYQYSIIQYNQVVLFYSNIWNFCVKYKKPRWFDYHFIGWILWKYFQSILLIKISIDSG